MSDRFQSKLFESLVERPVIRQAIPVTASAAVSVAALRIPSSISTGVSSAISKATVTWGAGRPVTTTQRSYSYGAWIETGLVFTTRYGTPIEPRNFNRSFDRRIIKAKVPKITVHSTRRTCGSLLATLDVHPRVAMQILRHSKIALTMEIYTEVPSAATRAALKKLGQWLGN
jgi:Phage integrase family